MSKRALILGVAGQDGSWLADILLEKGYQVWGTHTYFDRLDNVEYVRDRITLEEADLSDASSLSRVVADCGPHEVYNVADIDTVAWGRALPGRSLDVTAGGPLRLLEAIWEHVPDARLFQPASLLVFGSHGAPWDESSPLNPESLYACAKAYAWHACRHYRREYGLYVSVGIMGNHDSPRRKPDYLLQKICRTAVQIARGQTDTIPLGNLGQRVDIGYAREYMEAAWLALQQDRPDDYVICTGHATSVRGMVEYALNAAELGGPFDRYVSRDPAYYRDPPPLPQYGVPDKIGQLGWKAQADACILARMLVDHFLKEGP